MGPVCPIPRRGASAEQRESPAFACPIGDQRSGQAARGVPTAKRPRCRAGGQDAHSLTVPFENDLSTGLKAELVAEILWDDDLSLGADAMDVHF